MILPGFIETYVLRFGSAHASYPPQKGIALYLQLSLQSMLHPQQSKFDAQYVSHLSSTSNVFAGDLIGIENDFITSLLLFTQCFLFEDRINSLEKTKRKRKQSILKN